MMKKIIEKILQEALKRFMQIILDGLERMLGADLDGDGDIGGKKIDEDV
jgi:hypothetical protein